MPVSQLVAEALSLNIGPVSKNVAPISHLDTNDGKMVENNEVTL